jgi:hypothetical protein
MINHDTKLRFRPLAMLYLACLHVLHIFVICVKFVGNHPQTPTQIPKPITGVPRRHSGVSSSINATAHPPSPPFAKCDIVPFLLPPPSPFPLQPFGLNRFTDANAPVNRLIVHNFGEYCCSGSGSSRSSAAIAHQALNLAQILILSAPKPFEIQWCVFT